MNLQFRGLINSRPSNVGAKKTRGITMITIREEINRDTVKVLLQTLDSLIKKEVPTYSRETYRAPMTSMWVMTRTAMVGVLGRPLTREEMTCLSLSRHYGPTPALTREERMWAFALVGNGGEWMEWRELYSDFGSWLGWGDPDDFLDNRQDSTVTLVPRPPIPKFEPGDLKVLRRRVEDRLRKSPALLEEVAGLLLARGEITL